MSACAKAASLFRRSAAATGQWSSLASATLPHAVVISYPILIDSWAGLFTTMSILWRFSEASVSVMAITGATAATNDRPRTAQLMERPASQRGCLYTNGGLREQLPTFVPDFGGLGPKSCLSRELPYAI